MPTNPGNRLPIEYRPELQGRIQPTRPDPDPRHAADLDEAQDAGGPERARRGDLGMKGVPEPKHSAESRQKPFVLRER